MSESLQQIRWVSQVSGRSVLYVLLSVPVVVALVMVYGLASLSFPPGVRDWAYYGLFLIFLPWGLWMVVILTGPDGSRPPKMEAAARQLGLSFAIRPAGDEPVLPLEFPLARRPARWLLSRRRGPHNLIRGEIGGRTVWVFDIAYPTNYGRHVGYQAAGPAGESHSDWIPGAASGFRPWMLLIVPLSAVF